MRKRKRVLEFGYIARKQGKKLEQLMVNRRVEGLQPRGRSLLRWSDHIRNNLDS